MCSSAARACWSLRSGLSGDDDADRTSGLSPFRGARLTSKGEGFVPTRPSPGIVVRTGRCRVAGDEPVDPLTDLWASRGVVSTKSYGAKRSTTLVSSVAASASGLSVPMPCRPARKPVIVCGVTPMPRLSSELPILKAAIRSFTRRRNVSTASISGDGSRNPFLSIVCGDT